MKNKVIIFDLDGVLINSISNMKFALHNTSKKMNVKLNFELYRKYIGLPFEDIMKKMKIKKDIKEIKKNYDFFSEQKIKKIKIKKNILKELMFFKKNYYLAVFTSKNKKRTLKILKKYKLFDCIITSDDTLRGKPNPEGLNKIISTLKVKKKNSMFIGDSLYDYLASNSAKIRYIHAMWGYGKNIKKKRNLIKIGKFSEISKLI